MAGHYLDRDATECTYRSLQKGRFASAAVEAGGENGSREGVQRSAASIATAIESFGGRPVRQHDTVKTLFSTLDVELRRPSVIYALCALHFSDARCRNRENCGASSQGRHREETDCIVRCSGTRWNLCRVTRCTWNTWVVSCRSSKADASARSDPSL